MPAMFPSMVPSSDDPNRKVSYWKPGDPTPRIVIVSFAMLIVLGLLMVFFGFLSLTASWDREPLDAEEAERMDFVRNNVRILGGINIVVGAALMFFSPGVRDGYRGKRRLVLWIGAVGILFMLAGWVFGFTGPGQAVLALLLAVALLMAYRPAVNPYFDAGHRLDEAPIEGDGTLPGDSLRK
ncbi:hypothetical protein ACKFRT_09635 [Corynebacterium sp. YSMAA1_1_F7]|uniref:hypothetical protein n=1 Tax=Corynebacterium sp. YSMAA1_1_F7 TaxID=3383590 RepID=UPI0038D156CC